MYSIKAVAQATGLTVETLRAWERRYQAVTPRRDDSGRRVYGPEDVMRLRRLREATDRGHPISRLVRLDDAGISALLNEPAGQQQPTSGGALVERILESAEHYRPAECEQLLTLAIALLPPAQLIDDVLRPLLLEVGNRWHAGEFSIAQEHLVSGSVRRLVGMLLDTYNRTSVGDSIVFATLPEERHEAGLLMSAMFCASRGFRVHYLGPDLPVEDIASYTARVSAQIIALSFVVTGTIPDAPLQLRQLSAATGPTTTLWLGGSAVGELTHDDLPGSCVVIVDQLQLERHLDLLQAA